MLFFLFSSCHVLYLLRVHSEQLTSCLYTSPYLDTDLQADIKKCEFSVKRTKYLDFIISTDGIEVDPEKISAVKSWQSLKTVKGI